MAFDMFKRTNPKPGLGYQGEAIIAGVAPTARLAPRDGSLDGKLIVQRRHVDWLEHQIRWRWLMDSLEGGDRYRNAVYGPDRRGLPCRNLFRHKREYPDPQQFPNYNQGFGGFLASIDAQSTTVGSGPYPGQLAADPAATAMDVELRARRGSRADEQRGGTSVAACGDLAADQRWDRWCAWEPIRRANADGGGEL